MLPNPTFGTYFYFRELWERIVSSIPGYPLTHYVAKDHLELDSPAFPSHTQGMQASTTVLCVSVLGSALGFVALPT